MSLYAAYACNEGSGTTIIDYSGNGRNMTITGTNSWVTGHGSYANAFLGSVTAGTGAEWDGGAALAALSGDVTLMGWYEHQGGPTTQEFAFGLYSGTGTARLAAYSYRNLLTDASSPEFTVRDVLANIYSFGSNGTTADNAWHHTAAVYHAAGTVDIYVDGTLIGSFSTAGNAIGTTVRFISAGAILSGASGMSAVQDIRVFDSALTGTDVTTFMNTPVAGLLPGAAAFSGTGTLGASPAVLVPGGAALAGSGLLGASGVREINAASGISGTGILSASGQKELPGAVVFSGAGILGASGQKELPGGVAFSGTGIISASGQKTVPGQVLLAGLGILGAVTSRQGAAVLAGTASLSAGGAAGFPGAASLNAVGVLGAAAVLVLPGAAVFAGAGVLSGGASVSGGALLGVGTLQVAGGVTRRSSVLLSGIGMITATGHAGGLLVIGAASFSAAPSLTCFPLSARIIIAANIMFPANQSGTYGAAETETTVIVPGVTDGIYT